MTEYCPEYWKISQILWRAQAMALKDHALIADCANYRFQHLRTCPQCTAHFQSMTEQARRATMPEFEE